MHRHYNLFYHIVYSPEQKRDSRLKKQYFFNFRTWKILFKTYYIIFIITSNPGTAVFFWSDIDFNQETKLHGTFSISKKTILHKEQYVCTKTFLHL